MDDASFHFLPHALTFFYMFLKYVEWNAGYTNTHFIIIILPRSLHHIILHDQYSIINDS